MWWLSIKKIASSRLAMQFDRGVSADFARQQNPFLNYPQEELRLADLRSVTNSYFEPKALWKEIVMHNFDGILYVIAISAAFLGLALIGMLLWFFSGTRSRARAIGEVLASSGSKVCVVISSLAMVSVLFGSGEVHLVNYACAAGANVSLLFAVDWLHGE